MIAMRNHNKLYFGKLMKWSVENTALPARMCITIKQPMTMHLQHSTKTSWLLRFVRWGLELNTVSRNTWITVSRIYRFSQVAQHRVIF